MVTKMAVYKKWWALAGRLVFFLVLLTGCAADFMPIADREEGAAVIRAFYEMLAGHQDCSGFLDAEMEVKIVGPGLFGNHTGVLSGYLQAMAPSYLKFVGLNPLGQPQLVVATDGQGFSSIVVAEAKSFEGPVNSAKFKKYAPPGFSPEVSFFWLAGRLARDRIEVAEVSRAPGGDQVGYWLTLVADGDDGLTDSLLFDPQQRVILQHMVRDREKRVVLEVSYDDYRTSFSSNRASCPLPCTITVSSLPYRRKMILSLGEIYPETVFTPADFELELPEGFERVLVE